jgi:pimeloyl-ACP methyl ester carboxylesterase
MTLRRQAIRLLILLTVGYGFYSGMAWGNQTDIIFPGRHRTPDPAAVKVRERAVSLLPDDPARRALLFRADAAGAPLVVIAHGNGEMIDDWIADVETLPAHGLHVLLVEYPGYGGLPGTPDQPGIRDSFERGLDAALKLLAPEKPRVIGWGYSIGAAVIADLSRTRPLDGMVLHAPFRSLKHMAARRGLPPALVRDPFDTLEAVREFAGPVVVVHGLNDSTIPPEEGRAVAATARIGRFIGVPGSNHDAGLGDWDAAIERVIELARIGDN